MDGESSQSPGQIWKYDVFLSFRESDTGNNFTYHLFAALKRKGIFTFFRPSIFPEAIEQSQISIVVLSRNYAASTWRLDELTRILECHHRDGQAILPVFYDVDSSVVRRQEEDYGQVFAKHEEKFREHKVQKWRQALTEVANLSGWDVPNRLEAEVIDSIVKRAINILSHRCLSVAYDLVGIESRINEVLDILDLWSWSGGARIVGIWGMAGIGKTALASVLYHRIFQQFETCCFLANVSEFSKSDGLISLQEQLLRATLEWKDLEICNVYEGCAWIRKTLECRKTLLVLDNVDELEQLENLARYPDWFGAGSIIIITTRDEQILKRFGVNRTYKVESLDSDEALGLFCTSAFKRDYPITGYEELTYKVLEYAKGLPLALKSLGSFLHDRSVSEWNSTLAILQKIPDHSIMKVLRQSFEGLPNDIEEGIFLDIAQFFVGENVNSVEEIQSRHRFYSLLGNKILIDKSLMTISNHKIHTHDMLGEILQQETLEELGRRTRLWFYDDFHRVMDTNIATTNIEAMVLNQEDLEGAPLNAKAFSKMVNLRLLIIRNVNFSGSLDYLSDELVYVSWHKYPFTYLPSHFEPYGLVELIMPESGITRLWEGIKMLPKLKSMNLRDSKNLSEMPDFSGVLNLEMLDLEGCVGLLQLHPSIAILPKLSVLNLKNCTRLVSIPNNLFGLSSLETLNLEGCSIQMKLHSYQHCPFFVKMLCHHFISFLKGMKNNKLVFCCLVCLIYSIFSACNYYRSEASQIIRE